jgi:hypothetical protein
VIARDTSPAAAEAQRNVLRRMSSAQRFELIVSAAETGRELARAGIRHRHPDYSPEDVESAMLRLLLGDDLYRRAWPTRRVLEP